MYCKRCGMDSQDTEVCEWCKQPMLKAGPPPPGGAEEEEEPDFDMEAEGEEEEPMLSDEDDEYDAGYLPDEESVPRATRQVEPEQPPMSEGARFGIAVASGVLLGLISILLVYFITKEPPSKVYAGMIKLPGEGISTTLICGVLFGAALGVMLGGFICLIKQGPIIGLPLGAVLGYVFLAAPYSIAGLIAGAITGVIAGIAATTGRKKKLVL